MPLLITTYNFTPFKQLNKKKITILHFILWSCILCINKSICLNCKYFLWITFHKKNILNYVKVKNKSTYYGDKCTSSKLYIVLLRIFSYLLKKLLMYNFSLKLFSKNPKQCKADKERWENTPKNAQNVFSVLSPCEQREHLFKLLSLMCSLLVAFVRDESVFLWLTNLL